MKKIVYWFALLCQYFPCQSVRNWSATWLARKDKELINAIEEAKNGKVYRTFGTTV